MNELKKSLLKNAKIKTEKNTVEVEISVERENNKKLWAKLVDLEVKVWLNDNGYKVGRILKRDAVSNFESDENLNGVFLFEKVIEEVKKPVETKPAPIEKKQAATQIKKPTRRTRKRKTKEE
jgi:hypothetical protein